MLEILSHAIALAQRDMLKFIRDRGRILASFVFPLVFLAIFATTLDAGIGQQNLGFRYVDYVFSGMLLQSVFQSSFMGIVSLIADREKDFSMSLFVSPVSRVSIVLGKILGETIVGLGQMIGVIFFGILLQVQFSLANLLLALPIAALAGLVGGSLGILMASRISQAENAQRIFPFVTFPMMFLSGAFTPVRNLPLPLEVLKTLNPLFYGVDLMRHWLYRGTDTLTRVVSGQWQIDLLVFVLLGGICFFVGTALFTQKEGNR